MMAQERHMTFVGVPIDGTLSEYIEAMESKGFEEDGKRTYCRTMRLHFYDWIWAAALIAAAACGPFGLL